MPRVGGGEEGGHECTAEYSRGRQDWSCGEDGGEGVERTGDDETDGEDVKHMHILVDVGEGEGNCS